MGVSSPSVSEEPTTPQLACSQPTGDDRFDAPTAIAPDETLVDCRREWPIANNSIDASVVIVTYRTQKPAFLRTLDRLAAQTTADFEIVVVDNGTEWDLHAELARRPRVSTYLRLAENYGVTTARNVGAQLATGDVLVFLDDDALPTASFVESHQRLYRDSDIVAARGRVLPRRDTIYNRLQSHYDLGPESCPHVLNIEGNTSFDRDTFLDYGGYDARLDGRAGHEGLDLSYRLVVDGDIDRRQVVYDPHPVIYHDYAGSLSDFVTKRCSRSTTATRLDRKYDDLPAFVDSYDLADTESDLHGLDYLRLGVLAAMVRLARWLPTTR